MQKRGKISPVEMRHFRLVAAISQTENLTKAAKTLCISQPAASQCLKELENFIQTTLFVRTKKRMILTQAGKKVLQSGQKVLAELGEMETRLAKMVYGETGELRIGMHCVLSWRWLPNVVKQMEKAYPRIKISVGNVQRYVSELLEDKWDVIITAVPHDHPALYFSTLFSDEVVLVMHPDHPMALKKEVSPLDLDGARLISLAPQEKDILLNSYLTPAGVKLDLFMTVEQPEAVKSLVAQGFGISVLPKWAVLEELKSGVLRSIPFTKGGMQVIWSSVRLAADSYPPYHNEFIRLSSNALMM